MTRVLHLGHLSLLASLNLNNNSNPRAPFRPRNNPNASSNQGHPSSVCGRSIPTDAVIDTTCTVTPSAPPPPPGPTRKTWFDKLADAVLGGEDDVPRFALICEKCFAHNGLVKESALDDTREYLPFSWHLHLTHSP